MFTALVRGRTSTKKWGAGGGALVALAALAMGAAFAAPAQAAPKVYTFTKVVASTDGFDQNTLSVTCPSINNLGDIAIKSSREGVDGIYRVNAGGGVTNIAEVGDAVGTAQIDIFTNGNPSMNDSGQVSFGALLSDGSQAILRGDGTPPLTTIARTGTGDPLFTSFEEETSINSGGEVAFYGNLAPDVRGLFSGTGGPVTTKHYLNNEDVLVDGSAATFDAAPLVRPSINDAGNIAFRDVIQGTADIFRGQEGSFTTISAADRPDEVAPLLNNLGTVAWHSSSFETGFVSSILTGNGSQATTVVDTAGGFEFLDSFSLNNTGAVAFTARLDGDNLGFPSIYVGPNPKKNKVIGPGDRLDGGTVVRVNFCEEGLNDSGLLAFVAEIEDRNGDVRTAVFRATPPTR